MEENKLLILNKDYTTWLNAVKEQVRVSQLKLLYKSIENCFVSIGT